MKIMIKIPIFCLSRRLGHKGLTKNYLSKYRVERPYLLPVCIIE